jgi:ABC-type antimicrobial peptide transport system permease subunit
VFYLSYLRNELVRRKARTILTVLGLALGVALVIAISALSRGLDEAQKTALDPLASIGTDLTITLAPEEGPGGGTGFGGARQLVAANQSVLTDLSKLGKPGEHFVHDFFLPGTQLTFRQKEAQQIASVPGVAQVAQGLTLLAVHQEGTVPKIVARFKTGGQRIQIDRQLKPPTAAELAAMQACFARNGITAPGQPGQGRGGAFGGLGQGGQGNGQRGGANLGGARECLPDRFRRFRDTIVTPRETLQQVLDPPQTNISSEPYTIAGVDLSGVGSTEPPKSGGAGSAGAGAGPQRRDIGVVTPAQVTSGRFIARAGGHEALLSATYASRQKLKVGSTLELNGKRFRIVGLVKPPLGGQAADVYLPLAELQALAGQKGMANVVLVRATSSSDVASVQEAIEQSVPGAQVASAKQVADRISGSLVDAANLSHSLGLALSAVAAAAAFLLAALLTLSSIGKRVRELGTLKALGWSQRIVVRQVVGESLVQGLVGGLLGVGLGIGGAFAVDAFGPTLTASSTTGGSEGLFGLGRVAQAATDEIQLTAPVAGSLVAIGLGLALLGGLLAGAAGAMRVAHLRPADALRQVE